MGISRFTTALGLASALALGTGALAADRETPRLVQKNGRYALMVDGAPVLMLGAQVNNSSAWPSQMPKVWPAIGPERGGLTRRGLGTRRSGT